MAPVVAVPQYDLVDGGYSSQSVSRILNMYIDDVFRTRDAIVRLEAAVVHIEHCVVTTLVLLALVLAVLLGAACVYSCQRYTASPEHGGGGGNTRDSVRGSAHHTATMTKPRKPIEL